MRRSVLSVGGWTLNRLILRNPSCFQGFQKSISTSSRNSASFSSKDSVNSNSAEKGNQDEEFRTLDLVKSTARRFDRRKRRERREIPPPRYLKMPVDQDWGSVWPVARTFHPASVPLPLHQGYVPTNKAPPGKFGNLELMKISNFLHLTPPAIKRHCEALKKFCTPWPEELKNNYVVEQLLPIEIVTNDYCHSLPTIRDVRTRIVTLQVKVSFLKFDCHAMDKFLRLVGDRYDPATDILTIVTENCPLRKQNYDHAKYLLTALYHESWNQEPWEEEKSESDMETYIWEGSVSQKTVDQILGSTQGEGPPTSLTPTIEQYKEAVVTLHNQGEDAKRVEEYGKSVRELFNLPMPTSTSSASSFSA